MEKWIIVNGVRYVPEILLKKKELELQDANLHIKHLISVTENDNRIKSSSR